MPLLRPPVAARRPEITRLHGHELVDDYAWLRQKDDPAVLAHLREEDAYADAVMAPLAPLEAALYQEMLGHIQETDATVPYRDGRYWYYSRTEQGLQHPVLCRKPDLEAAEQLVLDPNELARDRPFLAIGATAVSDDGRWLAYAADVTGYRQYTLRVKDLETGRLLPLEIDLVNGLAWAADSRTLFYVTEDPVTKRQYRLWRRSIDEPASHVVYEEDDPLFDVDVSRTRDRRLILVHAFAKTSSETRYLPASAPEARLQLVMQRSPGHEYDVSHRDGRFVIRTNLDAKNFRVVTAPVEASSADHWTDLVAHRPAVKIDACDVFAGHAVLSVWEGGLEHLDVLDLETGDLRRLAHPEPVHSVSLTPNPEFHTARIRFAYQSPVTPYSVFELDMTTGQRTLLKETPVPGGFRREDYMAERVLATAPDGTEVPMSLVSRRDVPRDGTAPLLLYGYGSYGLSIPPSFSAPRLALLDRGVIHAVAHVRGGGELGEPWREQGRMQLKLNTFTDFIACAEHLVRTRRTSSDRLVIQGGSAGGMLVAGVANMRPDLFRAAIAHVPFVDVINTMLDDTLPLTTSEYIEWGDPRDPDAFAYMRQYSPYDNIRAQEYPAMLVWVALHDSQVPFWEGAKFVAKLRALKTGDRPVLLKVTFDAGHGGPSGRYDALRESARTTAFALWQMGRYTLQDLGTNRSSNSDTA